MIKIPEETAVNFGKCVAPSEFLPKDEERKRYIWKRSQTILFKKNSLIQGTLVSLFFFCKDTADSLFT
jgi:hypothetical protein